MSIAAERLYYTTGEVAKILGVTSRAIRLAEAERRIRPARREQAYADRVFDDADVEDLRSYFTRSVRYGQRAIQSVAVR